MEITLNREQAMRAVTVAKNFAAGASGLKVLQGVLVSAESGRVRLVTTDLDLWCQVDLDAQTPDPGEVLVPVRSLETMFKNTPQSRVQLRSEGEGVVCEAGSSEMRLQGLDVEDYPDVDPPDGCLLEMPLAAAVIDKVAYAVSRDETRYTLCGVRLEVEGRHLKLVATDGHRLARFQGMLPPGSVCDAGEEPLAATLPVRLLTEGVRLAGKLGWLGYVRALREGGRDPDQRVHPYMEPVDRRSVPSLRGSDSFRVHGYGVGAERRLVQRRLAPRSPVKGPPLCGPGVVC